MNRGLTLSSVVLAVLLVISSCTSMTGQTAGQYVDDTTITASVKAKLVGDKTANLTRIEVDPTNQVVTLNGIVNQRIKKPKRNNSPVRWVESKASRIIFKCRNNRDRLILMLIDIPYEGHDLSFGMWFSAIRRKGLET